jgi:hypothetical protein
MFPTRTPIRDNSGEMTDPVASPDMTIASTESTIVPWRVCVAPMMDWMYEAS